MFNRKTYSFKVICSLVIALFTGSNVLLAAGPSTYNLPSPAVFVPLSKSCSYPALKGIKVDTENPFNLEFIIDTKDKSDVNKAEAGRLIEYFLAAVTIPEQDLWVNLSPYEKDRVTSEKLSFTELGKDLLGQDYLLKQLLSSLTYPESKLGKQYWGKAYKEIRKIYGSSNIPIDTFNKVWIMPAGAQVYEKGNVALIGDAKLKVMHEQDYLALRAAKGKGHSAKGEKRRQANEAAARALKEVIIPKIEREVNYGENFAKLRQIYSSFILASWFKKKLKNSLYQHYIDQGKIEGVDLEDKNVKENIYNLYVQAYKNGIYDYVKKDYDAQSRKKVSRRYYSGGIFMEDDDITTSPIKRGNILDVIKAGGELAKVSGEVETGYTRKIIYPLPEGLGNENFFKLATAVNRSNKGGAIEAEVSYGDETLTVILKPNPKAKTKATREDFDKAADLIKNFESADTSDHYPTQIPLSAYQDEESWKKATAELFKKLTEKEDDIYANIGRVNEHPDLPYLVPLEYAPEEVRKQIVNKRATVEQKERVRQARKQGLEAVFTPVAGDARRLGLGTQKIVLDFHQLLTEEKEAFEKAIGTSLGDGSMTEEQAEELRWLRDEHGPVLKSKTILQRILDKRAQTLTKKERARQTFIFAPSKGTEQAILDDLVKNNFFGFDPQCYVIQPQVTNPEVTARAGDVNFVQERKAGGNGVPFVELTLKGKGYIIGKDNKYHQLKGSTLEYVKNRGVKIVVQTTVGDYRAWKDEDPWDDEFVGIVFDDLMSGKIAAAGENVKQNPELPQKGGTVLYNYKTGKLMFIEKSVMDRILGAINYLEQPLATFTHVFRPDALMEAAANLALVLPVCIGKDKKYADNLYTELIGGDFALNALQKLGHEVVHVERPIKIDELKGTASMIPGIRIAVFEDTGEEVPEFTSSSINKEDGFGGIVLKGDNIESNSQSLLKFDVSAEIANDFKQSKQVYFKTSYIEKGADLRSFLEE